MPFLPIVFYKKGDYTYILKDKAHCLSNVSNYNRYTLQVTGFAKTEDLTWEYL